MKTYLEKKYEDIKEEIFIDQIIYGKNCLRIMKDGKLKNNMIFLDLEEETHLVLFNISDNKKEILRLISIKDIQIDIEVEDKIRQEIKNNNSKNFFKEINFKNFVSLKTANENIELIFPETIQMDYFLKGIYLILNNRITNQDNNLK